MKKALFILAAVFLTITTITGCSEKSINIISTANPNITENEFLLYVNKDNDLYYKKIGQEKEKLASDVMEYIIADNGRDIAFTNKSNELYYKHDEEEVQKVIDDVSVYSKVLFANTLLYEKRLQLSDLVGIWRNTEADDGFLEITADGKAIWYEEGQKKSQYQRV